MSMRKIHLDFHTPADVTRVGSAFDPAVFADTLARAHVTGLVTPGKCQFGYTYFDTHLSTPHPGLARADLFPATVRACVERGVQVQAYFTLGLDEVIANEHPEWRQWYQDGTYAHWDSKHICFASPYADTVVIPQALEMLERCPGLCGFWFDISLYCDGAFYSESFERAARERLGARAEDRRERWQLGRQLIRECCQRIDTAIQARLPGAVNYFNSLTVPGEAGNIPLQAFQEVEQPVLFGSPEGMQAHVRWLRGQQAPVIGLVSRFQGPWMDYGTLRTPDQLRFDVGRVLSLTNHVSMGDHRHPDGTLDREVYRRIGDVYAEAEACAPWLDDARPCREAGLLTEIQRGTAFFPALTEETLHAARVLEELGVQFDLFEVESDLPDLPLLIWPGTQPATPALRAQLERHLANGAALLAMDAAGEGLEELFGIQSWQETVEKEFFLLSPEFDTAAFAHVITRPAHRFVAAPATTMLAARYPSWCTQPPCPERTPSGPAIIQHGRAIYSAVPLFAEHQATGTPFPLVVIDMLIDRLLPAGRMIRHTAGPTVAAHLHRVPQGYTVHLLHWALDRWGRQVNPTAVFPLLGPITVTVRIPASVRQVTLEPSGAPLDFSREDDRYTFTIPAMRVWQVIGIQTDELSS